MDKTAKDICEALIRGEMSVRPVRCSPILEHAMEKMAQFIVLLPNGQEFIITAEESL